MKMKRKINLDTEKAAIKFVNMATSLEKPVYLTDGSNVRVSAKSLLGVLYATFDFTEIWLETEDTYYLVFKEFFAD